VSSADRADVPRVELIEYSSPAQSVRDVDFDLPEEIHFAGTRASFTRLAEVTGAGGTLVGRVARCLFCEYRLSGGIRASADQRDIY
jgi:hypothetical protein